METEKEYPKGRTRSGMALSLRSQKVRGQGSTKLDSSEGLSYDLKGSH